MEREPIPQVAFSSSLVALSLIFFYLANLIPGLFFSNNNLLTFVGVVISVSILAGTLISQLAISIWSVSIGFPTIDYSKDFLRYGPKKIVQIVFDRFVHNDCYLPKAAREYARRRITVYWLWLVAQTTSISIIFTGTIMFLLHKVYFEIFILIFYLFFVSIIYLGCAHKINVADELYFIEKFHLKKYKDKIKEGIECFNDC